MQNTVINALALGITMAGQTYAQPTDLSFIDTFKSSTLSHWEPAHYDFTHPHFDTDWKKGNVVFGSTTPSNAGILLNIHPQPASAVSGNRFSGASLRRSTPTHFGRYESWLKPARGAGFVTGFFTYTGPYYGTRHDEIDIEFLGKNTRQIHIAWFHDGVLNNRFIDLPFDAADSPRLYAFEWYPDRIEWYVEDELIFSTHLTDGKLPNLPSFLFVNLWAADHSIANWAGKTKSTQSGSAWFGHVAFTPLAEMDHSKTQDAAMTIETMEFAVRASDE